MLFFSRLSLRAKKLGRSLPRLRKPGGRRQYRPTLERLELRQVMHANVVLDAEHLSVFGSRDPVTHVVSGGLAPDSSITDRAIASGNWSDPSIWSDGLPDSGDNVLIPEGIVVTVDGDLSVDAAHHRVALGVIRDDGTLRFDPRRNGVLLADTILVEPTGVFEMGTAAEPIDAAHRARVIFADQAKLLEDALASAAPGSAAAKQAQAALNDYEARRNAWDPGQFSLGLLSHGDVAIHGAAVTSWLQGGFDSQMARLNLFRGATTINLGQDADHHPIQVPADWKVGDHLVLPGTQPTAPYYLGGGIDASDEVTITSISQTIVNGQIVNGTTFTISAPLQYDHLYGSFYVANMSRNASFESEAPGIVARRGHVMFMHNPEVSVAYAGFYGLGRTDKRRPIDDAFSVPDLDNPGQMTTDTLLANPNPALVGKTITLSDGTVLINGKIYQNNDPNGVILKNMSRRVLVQIPDPATGKSLLQIGRTGLNVRGRYAVHFHRADGDEPAVIAGSAVVDSPGWGIVNHSSNVDVEDNVVFNAFGAAFVTEAGDEIGTFNHNLAMKGLGSGAQVDGRKNVQDFGHDGDGFWLQGGNVTVTDNVVSGMRHAGYVFFPRGLEQKGLGQTMISGEDLPAGYGADPTKNYDVADVPLLKFSGNVAFGVMNGYESWFSLQHSALNGRTVVEDFTAFAVTGSAVFTPYTSKNTFKNVVLRDPVNYAGVKTTSPLSTGFDRNDLTSDFVFDHVDVRGFNVGINVPVVGTNTILGGTFNDLFNILIATTNSDTRVVNIDDAGPNDPVHFLDSLKTTVNGQQVSLKQYDIYLQANWQPLFNDLTRNFARDIVRIGLVSHNGQQVYFREQAYDFVPYPDAAWLAANPTNVKHGPAAAAFVPQALRNLTNQQLWDTYGLAIGGAVAPRNATPDPLVNGIVGPATHYAPPTYLFSQKWTDTRKGAYYLTYSYWNPSLNQGAGGYVYKSETSPSPLVGGWNVLARSFTYQDAQGNTVTQPISLLVYDEIQDPSFIQANPGQVLNLADVNNGAVFNLTGWIAASYGQVNFTATVKLNDARYVSALKTRADGTQYLTISFDIQNFAGTVTKISIDFDVTLTAPLLKDTNQVYLPYMDLSVTLKKLLGM